MVVVVVVAEAVEEVEGEAPVQAPAVAQVQAPVVAEEVEEVEEGVVPRQGVPVGTLHLILDKQ